MTIKVKPLVWTRGVVDWAKPMPGMKYVACSAGPSGCWSWWLDGAEITHTVENDEAAAKAAAQDDYEARILSAIEVVDPATIRAEALREAASVRWDRRYGDDWLGMSCAILALIDKEQDK